MMNATVAKILIDAEYPVDTLNSVVYDPVMTSTSTGLKFSHYNKVVINTVAQAVRFIEERS